MSFTGRRGDSKWRLILTAVILAFLAVTYFTMSGSLAVEAGDTALTVSYRNFTFAKTTYEIDYADIEQFAVYPTAPSMRKVIGANILKTRFGTFANTELGQFKTAIDDVAMPVFYVKTAGGAYMFSAHDAGTLEQTIRSHMGK